MHSQDTCRSLSRYNIFDVHTRIVTAKQQSSEHDDIDFQFYNRTCADIIYYTRDDTDRYSRRIPLQITLSYG